MNIYNLAIEYRTGVSQGVYHCHVEAETSHEAITRAPVELARYRNPKLVTITKVLVALSGWTR